MTYQGTSFAWKA